MTGVCGVCTWNRALSEDVQTELYLGRGVLHSRVAIL